MRNFPQMFQALNVSEYCRKTLNYNTQDSSVSVRLYTRGIWTGEGCPVPSGSSPGVHSLPTLSSFPPHSILNIDAFLTILLPVGLPDSSTHPYTAFVIYPAIIHSSRSCGFPVPSFTCQLFLSLIYNSFHYPLYPSVHSSHFVLKSLKVPLQYLYSPCTS